MKGQTRLQDFIPFKALVFFLLLLLPLYLGALFVAWSPDRFFAPLDSQSAFLPITDPIACSPWTQVSELGFGLPSSTPGSPAYAGEEGFEVLEFDGRLYVGMEADNTLGARLWRTRAGVDHPVSQADWEEVIAQSDGLPWGIADTAQVDHVDSLAAFKGMLYASAAARGAGSGTRLFRSPSGDPGTWEDALVNIGPGFGKPQNENLKDMIVFEGQLCGGTWNEQDGAEIWCTADGQLWEQKNQSGFGDPQNSIAWSTHVFDGALYVGVQHQAGGTGFSRLDDGRIYRTNSLNGKPEWELVLSGGRRSSAAFLLGDAGGRLYAAARSIDGIRIWSSETGDAGTWEPAGRAGMSGSRLNVGTVTDGGAVYMGRLHVAVANPLRGFRVWRFDGDGLWRVVGAPAEYDPEVGVSQLVVHRGSLYAWTSSDLAGPSVWRTTCRLSGEVPADASTPLSLAGMLVLAAVFAGGWARARTEQV